MISVFFGNSIQKILLILILLIIILIIINIQQPLLTFNMNLINVKSVLALVFVLLVKAINYTFQEQNNGNELFFKYFDLIFCFYLKIYIIYIILKWYIEVSFLNNKERILKISKRFSIIYKYVDGIFLLNLIIC